MMILHRQVVLRRGRDVTMPHVSLQNVHRKYFGHSAAIRPPKIVNTADLPLRRAKSVCGPLLNQPEISVDVVVRLGPTPPSA